MLTRIVGFVVQAHVPLAEDLEHLLEGTEASERMRKALASPAILALQVCVVEVMAVDIRSNCWNPTVFTSSHAPVVNWKAVLFVSCQVAVHAAFDCAQDGNISGNNTRCVGLSSAL